MPATISENTQSRPFELGDRQTRELVFDVFHTIDEDEVRTLTLLTAPLVYFGLRRRGMTADPLGGGVWRVVVRYEGNVGLSDFTFDTTGGTAHITQSLGTVGRYAPPGEVAPDFRGAIGVSEDRVEGTDIAISAYTWSETHHFSFADALELRNYSRVVEALTARFNDAPFRGRAAGEVLFLGGNGAGSDLDDYPITFNFAVSPNVFGHSVGGEAEPYGDGYIDPGYGAGTAVIDGVDKMGWDYLWIRYADHEDSAAASLVKRPSSVHVERVYYPGDFSLLGIGVG